MSDVLPGVAGRQTGHPVLVIDALDYGRAVLLQGGEIPWEPNEHARFLGQLGALLRPDRTLVDVGAFVRHLLRERPELIEAMAVRSRAGYALRTMLGDDRIRDAVVQLLGVVAASASSPLVLQLPSPGVWLPETARLAGVDAEADVDDLENASVYYADWLRRLAEVPIDTVLLDGRGAAVGESLECYGPLRGVAEHHRWQLALRCGDEVQSIPGVAAELAPEFWEGTEVDAPMGTLMIAEIPGGALQEHVLRQRKRLQA